MFPFTKRQFHILNARVNIVKSSPSAQSIHRKRKVFDFSTPPSPPLPPVRLPPDPSSQSISTSQQHNIDMIFQPFHASQQAAHRRRVMATTNCITDYEADLSSRDRDKQKRAIKEVLKGKVRDDWEWVWPPVNPAASDYDCAKDGYVASEESGLDEETGSEAEEEEVDVEVEEWIERTEWESNDSVVEDEEDAEPYTSAEQDVQVPTDRTEADCRKTRRRKRLLKEMEYNNGMACFVHRRNAWTGARHFRRDTTLPHVITTKDTTKRSSIQSSTSTTSVPASPTTRSFRTATSTPSSRPCSNSSSIHPSPVISTSHPISKSDLIQNWLLRIPIPPPILPPSIPMRQNINEKAYGHIYDKVILQAQTPYCPINLKIVVRACVDGWKRDGEWPPPSEFNGKNGVVRVPTGASIARRETTSREKADDGGIGGGGGGVATLVHGKERKLGFKRSLQRLAGRLGAGGHSRSGSEGGGGGGGTKEK